MQFLYCCLAIGSTHGSSAVVASHIVNVHNGGASSFSSNLRNIFPITQSLLESSLPSSESCFSLHNCAHLLPVLHLMRAEASCSYGEMLEKALYLGLCIVWHLSLMDNVSFILFFNGKNWTNLKLPYSLACIRAVRKHCFLWKLLFLLSRASLNFCWN